jgi:hypothetical protein
MQNSTHHGDDLAEIWDLVIGHSLEIGILTFAALPRSLICRNGLLLF